MSCYFVALINIHDPKTYQRYLDDSDEDLKRHQAEVLAVEDDVRVLEGDWPARRTVLIRFPSEEHLRRWYHSDEYQRRARFRRESSEAQIAVVSGRP